MNSKNGNFNNFVKKENKPYEKGKVKLKSEMFHHNSELIDRREQEPLEEDNSDAVMWGFVLGFILFFVLLVLIIAFTV